VKLSIATKIFLGFAIVILAFSGAAALTIFQMQSLRASVTVIWRDVVPITLNLRSLSRRIKAPERFLSMERPTHQQSLKHALLGMDPFGDLRHIEERLETLDQTGSLASQDADVVRGVRGALERFRTSGDLQGSVAGATIEGLEVDPSTPSEEVYRRIVRLTVKRVNEGGLTKRSPEVRATKRVLRRINRVVVEALRDLGRPVEGLHMRAESDERDATLTVVVVATVALLISLIMLFVSQLTLKPLRQLREAVKRVAAGDLRKPVEVRSADEVGQLAEEFNRMADALRARDAALARQREELLRAERLATIGKLAAQITHEVRNPLSSIGLNAELLEEELASSDDEARELLEAIQAEVQRVKSITEEYLRFARMPRPEMGEVELGPLLTTITGFLSHQMDQRGVATRYLGFDADIAPIRADPDQLRQVVINIVNNALDALRPEGGEPTDGPEIGFELSEIDPAASPQGGGVRLDIVDNGPGIDAEVADTLFEPFVTGKSGGTGLGLALSQKIMTEHGGTIAALSPVSDGRGTRFRIELPRHAFTERVTAGIKVSGH